MDIKVVQSFRQLAEEIAENVSGVVLLSGGSTLPPLLEELGSLVEGRGLVWSWNDERLVSYEDAGSNFGTARPFLKKGEWLPIPNSDSQEMALEYMRQFCKDEEMPSPDLLLLGYGDDGHIASLFPESEALEKEGKAADWMVRATASYEPKERWSWTMSALLQSKKVVVLAKGPADGSKAMRLEEALNDPKCDTPLARFLRMSKAQISCYRVEA